MNESKHTPGPWKVDRGDGGFVRSIGPIDADEFAGVAWFEHYGNEHNIQVMAAAPELLEALELAHLALSGSNMNMKVVERKARAAIAKAKGEEK